MNPFRALDEIVLPRLARGLRRIAGVGRGPESSRRGVAGAVVLALIGVGATAMYMRSRPEPIDETTGDVVRVGVSEGDQVPVYVQAARSEVAALVAKGGGETVALVSLSGYTAPSKLTPLLDGVTPVRAYARVPLPDVQTEIVFFPVNTVAADVPAAMKRTAAAKELAARGADQAAAALSGSSTKEKELRGFYVRDATVSRAEAAAYRDLCACVYGVVVRAVPARLDALSKRPGVRVVDPAPESQRIDRTVFLPLQPEQKVVVKPPPDSAYPSPTRS